MLVEIDFNLKNEIVHEKQTKLNMVLKVIFFMNHIVEDVSRMCLGRIM